MYAQPNFTPSNCHLSIPMLDMECDRFEKNNDLEMQLRDAEPANFYHDTFNPEE